MNISKKKKAGSYIDGKDVKIEINTSEKFIRILFLV